MLLFSNLIGTSVFSDNCFTVFLRSFWWIEFFPINECNDFIAFALAWTRIQFGGGRSRSWRRCKWCSPCGGVFSCFSWCCILSCFWRSSGWRYRWYLCCWLICGWLLCRGLRCCRRQISWAWSTSRQAIYCGCGSNSCKWSRVQCGFGCFSIGRRCSIYIAIWPNTGISWRAFWQ